MKPRLLSVLFVLALLTAGCFNRAPVNPSVLLKMGEKLLKLKKTEKAAELFEKAYRHSRASPEEKLFSFYRLGVCAEVSGDRDTAIFRYSGDEGNDKFFQGSEKIANYVKFGLHSLVVKKSCRPLEEILEIEKSNLQFVDQTKKKRPKSKPKTSAPAREPRAFTPPIDPGDGKSLTKGMIFAPPVGRKLIPSEEWGISF